MMLVLDTQSTALGYSGVTNTLVHTSSASISPPVSISIPVSFCSEYWAVNAPFHTVCPVYAKDTFRELPMGQYCPDPNPDPDPTCIDTALVDILEL